MIKIIKSVRKSISLRVLESWEVILKTPLFTSKKFIDDFLFKHKDWITKRQVQVNNQKTISFLEWEDILFLWEKYELILEENLNKKLIFNWERFILNSKYREVAKEIFIDFYKKQAKRYFEERVIFFAQKYNLEYREIKISKAKWKWWSCNSKKNLSFVYNLMLADKSIIDYVIIHELAHTKQMNHSPRFWEEVKKMMANYQEYRLWLKKYWNTLRF